MHTFDERGEAAIANLRRDKRFNEALYRELGPVKYWTQVREAEARIRALKDANGQHTLNKETHPWRHATKKEYEDTMINRTADIPVEKASQKDRSKVESIAVAIIAIGASLSIATVMIALAVMVVYGAWTWIF